MDRAKRRDLDNRNTRRRKNYWLAKELGYTAKEARLMCKWSTKHIRMVAGKKAKKAMRGKP